MAELAPVIQPTINEDMVRAEGARRLDALASGYSPQERETWAEQTLEALNLESDPNPPLLTALAAGRQISISAMAERVVANRNAFKSASALILGRQAALIAMSPIPSDFTNDVYWT